MINTTELTQLTLDKITRITMLLCFVKASFESAERFVAWIAEGGHDRDGPLAVEGRLLSGHDVSRPERGPGDGRRIDRRPAGGQPIRGSGRPREARRQRAGRRWG